MSLELLSKWLLHYDAIHRGWTPRGIANGACATNGFCFPRVAGGYNLYRGVDGEVDFDVPVGAAGAKACGISTFPWARHAASTGYSYALRAVGGGGVESEAGESIVTVAFDAAGQPASAAPDAPSGVAVRPVSGGRFELSWSHSQECHGATPDEFHVYGDGGSGVLDYEHALGTVAYRPRAGLFLFVTEPYMHGIDCAFGVRAASAGAMEENTAVVRAVADALAPAEGQVFVEAM